jgi:hypothetical protein
MGLFDWLRGSRSQAATKEDLLQLKVELTMTIEELEPRLDAIATDLKTTVDGQVDLASNLGAVGSQLTKAKEEIIAALNGQHITLPQPVVDKLEAIGNLGGALKANAETLKESSAGLKTISEALDALNADVPTPEPPATPPPVVQ